MPIRLYKTPVCAVQKDKADKESEEKETTLSKKDKRETAAEFSPFGNGSVIRYSLALFFNSVSGL
ncbi:hypothetical protein FACS18942_00980 [Planctomycetales bacterium]|nr:hypothetical protein FACS18942_00980 [Planctomycetales bacterium]